MTDGYLLDSTVASAACDLLSPKHSTVRAWLDGLGDAPVWVSAVTIGEIAYGLALVPTGDASRHAEVRAAMAQYRRLDINHHVAGTYAAIRAELFGRYAPKNKRGLPKQKRPEGLLDPTTSRELGIQENDLWILSTAVTRRLALATMDDMARLFEVADAVFGWNQVIIL
jgi:tRNA(fMet)-specific endonuclease VapC